MCKEEKEFGGLWFFVIMILVVVSVYGTIMFGDMHNYPSMEQGVIELMNSKCSIVQMDPCVEKEKPHGKSSDATKNGK